MAQNMSIPSTMENMQFVDIMHYVKLAGRDALKDFVANTNRWLIYYLSVTILSLILDMVNFFIQVKNFGSANSAYADLALVIISSIFLLIDWYYLLWCMSLMFKFPEYISAAFIGLFFGYVSNLNEKIAEYFKTKGSKFQERNRQEGQ